MDTEDLFGMAEEIEEVERLADPETPYRVLVTGSRALVDRELLFSVLDDLLVDPEHKPFNGDLGFKHNVTLIVHGGAKGADSLAEEWVRSRSQNRDLDLHQVLGSEIHPAEWERYGPRSAGMIRNSEMVKAGANICVGFPIGRSPGTRGCMDLASRAGIKVVNATGL